MDDAERKERRKVKKRMVALEKKIKRQDREMKKEGRSKK
jgi:hypothetical protein